MVEQGMQFQILSTRLYDAALLGDVPSLLYLLQDDPLILHRCSIQKAGSFTQSPLHVAANLGHLEFTREILCHEPELAEELDHSQKSSPLHMSSAKGHLEIVKALLEVRPEMCLAQDQNGRNPVHVAAIRGQIHVLQELLQAKPQAARERTYGGETVLHLCIKYNQQKVLQFLVNITEDDELLNSKDSNGNTILHLAVAAKQPETINFLLENERMEKNAINTSGLTSMDIWHQSRKDPGNEEIWRSLKRAKALCAKDALQSQRNSQSWLDDQRNALMVVASLIATMAFQVGVSPPGGAWQDDTGGHDPGYSIMGDVAPTGYHRLLIYNTVALLSSLSVILLLISGLPCKKLCCHFDDNHVDCNIGNNNYLLPLCILFDNSNQACVKHTRQCSYCLGSLDHASVPWASHTLHKKADQATGATSPKTVEKGYKPSYIVTVT